MSAKRAEQLVDADGDHDADDGEDYEVAPLSLCVAAEAVDQANDWERQHGPDRVLDERQRNQRRAHLRAFGEARVEQAPRCGQSRKERPKGDDPENLARPQAETVS